MNNFAIAVPSKGRVTSSTLTYLKNVADVPVCVYADESEASAYEEYYPEFAVVPHNKKNIGAIRRFIQEDQGEAGKTVFMLDDDMLGFFDETGKYSIPFRKVLGGIEDLLGQGYEIIGFKTVNQLTPEYPETLQLFYGAAMVLTPSLYAKKIRFTEEEVSEDTDFSIQLELHKDTVSAARLPYHARFLFNDASTHFGNAWYTKSAVNIYKKYGRVIKLALNIDTVWSDLDPSKFAEFKERGPVYSKAANNMLVSLYENKFIDEEFILDAMNACGCKRCRDGKYCYDWDYDGYDGSLGDCEALKHGHNCPCCDSHKIDGIVSKGGLAVPSEDLRKQETL